MHAEEYARMYELEDHYWWFVARRRLAIKLLKKEMKTERPRVLDLGCGTGVISRDLAEWANPVSLDMSELALAFSKKRGLKELVQARGEHLPVRTDSIDAILALDIFEHIEDDRAAFREAYRVLKPGGVLVLSVPAFKALWGPHDIALMHFRRYTRPLMRSRLKQVGFAIKQLSYSVFFLFPVVVAVRIIEKRRTGEAKASLPRVSRSFNKNLVKLQDIEASLISGISLPWGSSVIAVAKKPSL